MIAAARRGGLRWKERQGSSNWRGRRARVQVIGGVWNEAGRGGDVWQRGVKERTQAAKLVPRGFGSSYRLYTQKHTRVHRLSGNAALASAAPTNKGLMPSGGLQAARPHYPEMDKSIWSNYINQWNIRFLWKQMWVVSHKSLPSVKYSRTCDVSLSNEHLNSCITAVIDMMWWISDAAHLYIIYVVQYFKFDAVCSLFFFLRVNFIQTYFSDYPLFIFSSITWSKLRWFESITMATRCIMHEFYIPMPGVSVKLSLLVVFFFFTVQRSSGASKMAPCWKSIPGRVKMAWTLSTGAGWQTCTSPETTLFWSPQVATSRYVNVLRCVELIKIILILGKIIIMPQLLTHQDLCHQSLVEISCLTS